MPGDADTAQLEQENTRLKRELQELIERSKKEKADFEAKQSTLTVKDEEQGEMIKEKSEELSSIRHQVVRLTRQLDDEVARRDQVESESQTLERKLHDLESGAGLPVSTKKDKGVSVQAGKGKSGAGAKEDDGPSRAQVSTKLMRVVDQWMHTKDLQQALLRGGDINDMSFSTLVQVLSECKSLQMLDLAQNQLTMDSCSDICRLVTSMPCLSFVSLAENLFSLRSIGYFMTAVMERQNKKKLRPLEVLDLTGNEGLVAAMSAPPPEGLLKQVQTVMGGKLPPKGAELISQVMRALWRFLHYTEHPQVANTNVEDVQFQLMGKQTLRKMENALMKIMLMSEEGSGAEGTAPPDPSKSVYANVALMTALESDSLDEHGGKPGETSKPIEMSSLPQEGSHAPPSQQQQGADVPRGGKAGGPPGGKKDEPAQSGQVRDPFHDLKTAFEPPKDKLKTFNLKQIVTRNGTVLMNMLERLLESTEIDARDVETDQTLLEYACSTGNMGLAKLCYRRGANLSARTKKGDSYMNIVTKNKRYDLMEFLHTYGVKVNHQDAEGNSALIVAATGDDVDAICRLIEWGADVNMHNHKKRTALHLAAYSGHMKATMLLLELGAELNAKDSKAFTPAALAGGMNHFTLMDRLVALGGKGHGLADGAAKTTSKAGKPIGEITVTASMLKSSSLGRIGKVAVKDMPGQLRDRFSTKGAETIKKEAAPP